jgi:Flp pilus assembly protein TadD
VADALGRALHAAGRDTEALPYARRAVAMGPRNAAFAFHLAMVSLSLGDRAGARAQFERVRDLNPHFSPADGPTAALALSALEAQS